MSDRKWLKDYKEIEILISHALDSIMGKIAYNNLDRYDVIIFGLMKRIVSNYNSVKLLFLNNMNLEAMIIIRTIIESVFVLNALIHKPIETFDKLNKLSNSNKKQLHKMALSNEHLKSRAQNYDFEYLESSNVKVKDFVNLSPLNQDLYEIVYRLISNKVHINLLSIESFIVFEDKNKFSVVENFDEQEIKSAYFANDYCLFLTLQELNKKYHIGIDIKISEIERKLDELSIS